MCMAVFSRIKNSFRKSKVNDDDSSLPAPRPQLLKSGTSSETNVIERHGHLKAESSFQKSSQDNNSSDVNQGRNNAAVDNNGLSTRVGVQDFGPYSLTDDHVPDPRRFSANLSDGTDDSIEGLHKAWSETSLAKKLKREISPTEQAKRIPDFSISPTLECFIRPVVDREHLPEVRMTVAWLQHGEYQKVKAASYKAVKSFLEEKFGAKPQNVSLGRIDGSMRLVKSEHNDEVSCRDLRSEGHWAEYLPIMVGGFCAANPDVEVHLEIQLSFVTVSILDAPGKNVTEKVWNVMHERMEMNWKKENFLARTWIHPIFSRSIVRRLILEDRLLPQEVKMTQCERNKFVDTVFNFAQRLLAICVYSRTSLACLHRMVMTGPEDERKQDESLPILEAPNNVPKYDFHNFLDCQKKFNIFRFEASKDGRSIVKYREIDTQYATIPITFLGRLGEGSFGVVDRVRIHKRHHNFDQDSFALKCLKGENAAIEYDEEEKILTRLAELRQHGFSIPLAMWRQNNQCCMLFPLAESNLKDYLRKTPRPQLTKGFVLGLIQQIMNLADALHSIHVVKPSGLIAPGASDHLSPDTATPEHRRTGYHHDLKPENILIFQGSVPGIWKIHDFGTARIHSTVAGRSHFSRNLSAGDPDYSSPDQNNPKYKGTSRPYDIWSFGCILLEILVWIFDERPDRLVTFETDRLSSSTDSPYAAFWMLKDGSVELRPPVAKRLEELAISTAPFEQFFKLVGIAKDALELDPANRPDSAKLVNSLRIIQLQVEFNLNVEPECYLAPGHPQIAFASYPSSRWPDSNSNRSRSNEIQRPRRLSTTNLEIPASPHSPVTGPPSLRSRRSTESAIAGQQSSDMAAMGAHVEEASYHQRSSSNPQILVSNETPSG